MINRNLEVNNMSFIIDRLDSLLKERAEEIENWLMKKREIRQPFLYSSVDLRHSGYKLTPVDTNLFPAGFNNLSEAAKARAIRFFDRRLLEMQPNPQKILIIPENHTRNLGYLENLFILSGLLSQTGREVVIGNVASEAPLTLETLSGATITQYPVSQHNGKLVTQNGFIPDMIILNNDCTGGVPAVLENISQPIEPPFWMGWYNRRKSEHFRAYEAIATEFAEHFGFDPWFITAIWHRCAIVDFKDQKHIESAVAGVDKVIAQITEKYAEHGVKDKPYVFVKADSGTYGMGIMTVSSGEELRELNKKTRNKMNIVKEGVQNTEVIIQEGVPTIDKVGDSPAEAMLYLVDGIPIGGAYRVNDERDALSNLNANGMRFVGMCDESEFDETSRIKITNCNFHVFGLVSALATLAASDEVYDNFAMGFSI